MRKHLRFILVIFILLVAVLVVYQNVLIGRDAGSVNLEEFPSQIGEWVSKEVEYDPVVLSVLSPDRIIYKDYRDGSVNPSVTLFMAYYNTLEKAEMSHSPIVCFTGQGWDIERVYEKEIEVDAPSVSKIRVNEMLQKKLNTTLITLYWYQSANRAFANRGFQKFYLLLDRLLGKPDRNAFVRLTAVVPSGKTTEETTSRMLGFAKALYPALNGFFL